jgi:hypothetical protein
MGETFQEFMALWHWLEEGPGPPQHRPTVLGNLRLTAVTGLGLVLLLVIVYGTGVLFGDLRPAHFFTGFFIIPLILAKLASVGWRFFHYYGRSAPYRAAGPPWLLPRVLAVPLVLSTIIAVSSGVVLWALGTQRGTWSTIHTDSVVILLLLVGVHLAAHLRRAVRAVHGDRTNTTRWWRLGSVFLSVAGGVALASVMAIVEPTWHDQPRHGQQNKAAAFSSNRTFEPRSR